MKGKSGDFASLYTDQLQYLGLQEVNQYVVYSYKMFYRHKDKEVEIVIKVKKRLMDRTIMTKSQMGRNLLTIILTTFVPTVTMTRIIHLKSNPFSKVLLNMISYSTNYFKAFFFEAIVTVNLTAMLVLTTLFINVSNSLPPTSYLKMIDVYLIFSLLIPFLEVLLHTLMDSLRL